MIILVVGIGSSKHAVQGRPSGKMTQYVKIPDLDFAMHGLSPFLLAIGSTLKLDLRMIGVLNEVTWEIKRLGPTSARCIACAPFEFSGASLLFSLEVNNSSEESDLE